MKVSNMGKDTILISCNKEEWSYITTSVATSWMDFKNDPDQDPRHLDTLRKLRDILNELLQASEKFGDAAEPIQ